MDEAIFLLSNVSKELQDQKITNFNYSLISSTTENPAKYLITGAPSNNNSKILNSNINNNNLWRKNQGIIQIILIASAAGFAVFMFGAFGIVLACYKRPVPPGKRLLYPAQLMPQYSTSSDYAKIQVVNENNHGGLKKFFGGTFREVFIT